MTEEEQLVNKSQDKDATPEKTNENPSTDNKANSQLLELKLSQTLHKKLIAKSQAEGITVHDLASELLAEGLVLRAWEIMERKSTMRTPNSNASGNPQFGRNNSRYNFRNGKGQNRDNQSGGNSGNNRRQNYGNVLEDTANFMEYVRGQEKKKRR